MILRTLAFGLFALQLTPTMAQEAPKLFFEGDIVRGAGPSAKGAPCVLNSQFKRGENVIFRIRVLDPKTGKPLDDKQIKNLSIELSNGEKVPSSFRGHPPKDSTDTFFSAGWPVPAEQPTGSLQYKVVVTTLAGETVTWRPFNVAATQITVIGD